MDKKTIENNIIDMAKKLLTYYDGNLKLEVNINKDTLSTKLNITEFK
jgi:hypothetical protein